MKSLNSVLFLLLVLLASCSSQENSKSLTATYSNEEIAAINKLVEEFNSQVCDDPNRIDCIQDIFMSSDLATNYDVINKLDARFLIRLDEFVDKYPKVIWIYNDGFYQKKTKYLVIDVDYTTKFHKYLLELGKESVVSKDLAQYIEETGTLNVLAFDRLIKHNFKNEFLNDQDFNLVIAVYYLTLYYDFHKLTELGEDFEELSL